MSPETRSDLRSFGIGTVMVLVTIYANNWNQATRDQAAQLNNLPPANEIATKSYVKDHSATPLYRLEQVEQKATGNEQRSRMAITQINRICQHIDMTCATQNAVWHAPYPAPPPQMRVVRYALHDKRRGS